MARSDDPRVRIAQLRKLGMPDEAIFTRMLVDGWAAEELHRWLTVLDLPAPPQELVAQIRSDTPPVSAPAPSTMLASVSRPVEPEVQSGKDVRRMPLALITAVIAALAGTGFAVYSILQPPVVYSIALPASAQASSTMVELSYGALPALSEPDYYGRVKTTLIAERATFIDANLSTMRLVVYTGGERALDIPILAKGKVGSWWETPAGVYRIETREKDHFSSFAEVHMPYSMQFQGNFFIHGWPYYEDGTPVATWYSGGCIRLSNEDAKSVYDLVQVGVPVVVYNVPSQSDAFSYTMKAPNIAANAYLIADVKNGTVLASKNPAVAAPIASITKLVTALVATEYINLDRMLTVPTEAIVYTTTPRLKAGSQVRAYDLLYLLLQESSNEAAEVLASAVGRDTFVRAMNEKAKSIGLTHSVFSDPSGAKGDYSTPEDLFKLLRYIYDNRRFVLSITAGELKDTAYGDLSFKNVRNYNLIRGADLLGGKIGQTREALDTYAGIFTVEMGEEERDVAIIVLGSYDSPTDTRRLFDFVTKNYSPGQ